MIRPPGRRASFQIFAEATQPDRSNGRGCPGRTHDVESPKPFPGEILYVIQSKIELRQIKLLFEQHHFGEIHLPGLNTGDLHPLLRHRQREPTLESTEIGDPQTRQLSAVEKESARKIALRRRSVSMKSGVPGMVVMSELSRMLWAVHSCPANLCFQFSNT